VERSSGAAPPRRSRGVPRDKGADRELLAIEIEPPRNGLTVVALAGELDLSTVPRLEGRLLSEAKGQGTVVVDLTRLTFIDSSGIRLLIQAHQAADGRAALRTVVADGSQVERVFAVAGIEEVLPVFLDREEAIGAAKTGRTATGE
jgi:anti-sigma B factor antagonist